uniref:SET domain-containing protein n=1 Tax=Trypanosoma congolense (strain IL3000) TaxID=1068625 RepID=G0UJ75_TRYCI|nr:conserved hypothetical protein [Trypanosoma congolense IL3000]
MVGDGVCVNCGAYRSSLLPKNAPDEHDVGRISCGGCGLALYCSLSCANQYQSQHTQYECHLFKRLKEMRCALEASAEQNEVEGSQCEAPSNLIIDFFTMASHCITTLAGIKSRRPGYRVVLNELQGHAAEVSQNLSHMVRMVGELLRDEELPLEVARLIGIIRCNTIEVNNELSLGVGQALHATTITSYFNHSCSPNCAIQGEFIVTTRVIAAGEELTISYMPQLYWPVALRREELANTYYFHCSCERCRDNENDPFEAALVAVLRSGCEETGGGGGAQDGNNAKAARVCGLENHLEAQRKHITDVQTLCNRIRSMDPSDITTTDRNELQRLLQKCCEELYPFHYLCHELRNALSFTYAALGDTKDCLKSCLDELLLWECIVPGAHPVKRLKLLNSMQCCEDLRGKGDELGNNNIGSMALIPLLEKLSRLYCC